MLLDLLGDWYDPGLHFIPSPHSSGDSLKDIFALRGAVGPDDDIAVHLGGERPWFNCMASMASTDGELCGRRVTRLYRAGHLFACHRRRR